MRHPKQPRWPILAQFISGIAPGILALPVLIWLGLMKTQVEFRSGKFPPYDGEQEQINPGLWGKRLAEYLRDKLRTDGVKTGDIYSEDWGWALPIQNETFATWLGCGHQDGEEDEFLVFIEPSKPVIRKWFKKINTTEVVGRVAATLQKILASDPDIRDVRWVE